MTLILFALTVVAVGEVANLVMRCMFSIADSRIKSSLSLFSLFLVVWTLSVMFQSPAHSVDTNLFLVRIAFVAATSAVVAMLIFSYAVTHTRMTRRRAWTLFGLYAAIVALEISPYVISSVVLSDDGVIPTREPLYYAVSLSIVGISLYAIGRLFLYARNTISKPERHQRNFIATGLALGLLLAIITNIVLPNTVGNTLPARFSSVAVLILAVTIICASLKHKFVDLRSVAIRAAAHLFSLLTMAVTYFGLVYLLSLLLFEDITTGTIGLNIESAFIAVLLIVVFQPIRHLFDKISKKIFFRE